MNVYEIITSKIMEQLEQGVVPWQRPWKTTAPKNFISKKAYRGINILMLAIQGYACPYWATFNQIKKAGGSVKKGQKGTPVIFWKFRDKANREDETSEEDNRKSRPPILRYYRVFNLEQAEGIKWEADEEREDINPIKTCDQVLFGMPSPPQVTYDGGSRAFYRPATDSVHLPATNAFNTAEEHYSTLYHELVHSTGHKTRLDRTGIQDVNFGSETYSKEELIAEIGSAFLCGITKIENKTIHNSASYIQSWLKKLHDDKKLIVIAAAQAQKAVDYIINEDASEVA